MPDDKQPTAEQRADRVAQIRADAEPGATDARYPTGMRDVRDVRDLLAEVDRLQAELAETKEASRWYWCPFCNQQTASESNEERVAIVMEHIRTCEHHPLAKALAAIQVLEAEAAHLRHQVAALTPREGEEVLVRARLARHPEHGTAIEALGCVELDVPSASIHIEDDGSRTRYDTDSDDQYCPHDVPLSAIVAGLPAAGKDSGR